MCNKGMAGGSLRLIFFVPAWSSLRTLFLSMEHLGDAVYGCHSTWSNLNFAHDHECFQGFRHVVTLIRGTSSEFDPEAGLSLIVFSLFFVYIDVDTWSVLRI